jgi:hypothetical protein
VSRVKFKHPIGMADQTILQLARLAVVVAFESTENADSNLLMEYMTRVSRLAAR